VVQQGKRLEKIRNNPKGVSFEKLVALLESYGFEVKNYSGGSHYSVSHPIHNVTDAMEPNSIPTHKPHILSVYVKRALIWIDRVRALENKKEEAENDEQ
jgi:hypothetical protein